MTKTILIVEDTLDLSRMLSDFLKMEGYNTVHAMNGKEALEKIISTPPNLIITDLLMPLMDGYMLIEKLKGDVVLKNIPIIVFSARTDSENKDQALALGVNKFINKPSNLETILTSIVELVDH